MHKIACLGMAFACLCFGYIRLETQVPGDTSPVPLFRIDNTGIQILLNQGVVAGAQSSLSGSNVTVISSGSNPVAAVRASLATWNAVGTANIHFLPLQSTSAGINPDDDNNVISIAATANDLSAVGGPNGALMVTLNTYNPVDQMINGAEVNKGAILDSDVVINPSYPFSTDGSTPYDLQSVFTHEMGHTLSSNHATLVGTSMFWANHGQRFLSTDELTMVSTAYPLAGGGYKVGTLAGTVTAGGQPVAYAMISLVDPNTGISEGTLTAGDGTYSVQVPPGNYQLIAEPLTGVTKAANLYLTAAQATQSAAIAFQPTLAAAPPVTAGATTTANIAVTTGTSTLPIPLVTVTAVNGPALTAVSGGPVVIQSGQSVDLVLDGAGYDATAKIQVFGPGITLGSVRVDNNDTFGGIPIVRATLTVAASAQQFLATVFITKGSSTYSLTGALIITPPAPAFTSQSFESAASFLKVNGNGAVSPGGLYSIYATSGTSNLGPATAVLNGGYDAYGLEPAYLANVSVTFDGVPAPLVFVYGSQINLQAPFELAGKKTTQVVVNYWGSTNAPVTVPVVSEQPAFFTVTPEGTDSFVVNQDGVTLNSATTPEARGNYVTIYGTGVGQLSSCTSVTGAGAPNGCTASYTVTIGNQSVTTCQYCFAGWTPSAVGLAQWTVQIPANAATGAQTVVATDTATGASTPQGTIYIK